MTERLHFLSIVPFGEGTGNPLHCSCLESHGQRGLVGYSLWGCKESDTTEQVTLTHRIAIKEAQIPVKPRVLRKTKNQGLIETKATR